MRSSVPVAPTLTRPLPTLPQLMLQALRRGTTDNISVIVVKLR